MVKKSKTKPATARKTKSKTISSRLDLGFAQVASPLDTTLFVRVQADTKDFLTKAAADAGVSVNFYLDRLVQAYKKQKE